MFAWKRPRAKVVISNSSRFLGKQLPRAHWAGFNFREPLWMPLPGFNLQIALPSRHFRPLETAWYPLVFYFRLLSGWRLCACYAANGKCGMGMRLMWIWAFIIEVDFRRIALELVAHFCFHRFTILPTKFPTVMSRRKSEQSDFRFHANEKMKIPCRTLRRPPV